MSLLEDVTDQLNLRWAWEKVRRASTPGDVWIDEIELAGFEVQLEDNLQSIATEMRKGRYRQRPLRPMAFPKNPNKDGEPQVRQYFNVAVRDQVAWTAIVNVIGPHLDPLMPTWSYGNRLFRSIWVDEVEDGVRKRRIGRYRHSSGKIYLPFGQSWPVFRRHVFLATQAMTAKTEPSPTNQLADEDLDELHLQDHLDTEHRCPFVQKEYWRERTSTVGKENLYWCSIDLEKFYPSLRLTTIHQNIVEFLPTEDRADAQRLLESMFHFSINTNGWSKEELKAIGLKPRQRLFKGVPTGLFVAGFLANVGLLKVDSEVSKRIEKKNVSHFRFVDDHIFLAYSFEDLIEWVDEYLRLLASSETGARVNFEKFEPKELAALYSSKAKSTVRKDKDKQAADKACKLNPQFPTPLMTKTLALVSAIARTDIDLLEGNEITSLTDQLEHMLLVELPETEIPEKTRMSFAATRLMRLAECRLSNNPRLNELANRQQRLDAALENSETPPDTRKIQQGTSTENLNSLRVQRSELNGELSRAFTLLRKVLQERPDRVRLWARAIQMCRRTGVIGLKDILEDINKVKKEHKNTLAAEYLLANTLSLLGSESVIASRLVCDPDIAEWRRIAASAFLKEMCSLNLAPPETSERTWFLNTSWEQFCFGLFCADMIFKSHYSTEDCYSFEPNREYIRIGEALLFGKLEPAMSVSWAWSAARHSLRDLSPRASSWVAKIGQLLPPSTDASAIWRFFPFDVPSTALQRMRSDKHSARPLSQMAGWWYDVFSSELGKTELAPVVGRGRDISRVLKNINGATNDRFVSLQDWCLRIQSIREKEIADPRTGEWTALEIVRQVGVMISNNQPFSMEYISKAIAGKTQTPCLHPANFRVPREWVDRESMTWGEWISMASPSRSSTLVELVPNELRISDARYTPISSKESALFESLNQVRGLGLLLYGLLRHDFRLPCAWNGPGHMDVLNMLPSLLLRDVTCSSWTLGIMQACLQPRAMENLFFRAKPHLGVRLDDDTLHDPVSLKTPDEVCAAIRMCQTILEGHQLSTIDHRARQLTPISIRQLSNPNWTQDFGGAPEAGGGDEH